jgi:hypothetical protein
MRLTIAYTRCPTQITNCAQSESLIGAGARRSHCARGSTLHNCERCGGIIVANRTSKVPNSFFCHKSLILHLPLNPSSFHETPTSLGASARLNSATYFARVPGTSAVHATSLSRRKSSRFLELA